MVASPATDFVSPPLDRRAERRRSRSALWSISRNKRVRKCGRYALDTDKGVSVVQAGDVAHYSGLMLCGSIWSCPVCSAKIRNVRAGEVTRAVEQHTEAGGIAALVTLTVQHGVHHSLRELFGLVADGWRSMNSGREGKERRERYGVVGSIRTLEITHGSAGWHPHLHVLVFLEPGRTSDDVDGLVDELHGRWCELVESRGYVRPALAAQHGVKVERPRDAAAYVGKVQDASGASPIALELTRHDLKQGRRASRTPFTILRDFTETGDMADVVKWWEYEEVTRKRHAITWSKGLRARFDLEDRTDEEIAGEEVGGIVVAVIPHSTWAQVIRHREAGTRILEAAERSGIAGVRAVLRDLGLPVILGVPVTLGSDPP